MGLLSHRIIPSRCRVMIILDYAGISRDCIVLWSSGRCRRVICINRSSLYIHVRNNNVWRWYRLINWRIGYCIFCYCGKFFPYIVNERTNSSYQRINQQTFSFCFHVKPYYPYYLKPSNQMAGETGHCNKHPHHYHHYSTGLNCS